MENKESIKDEKKRDKDFSMYASYYSFPKEYLKLMKNASDEIIEENKKIREQLEK